MADEQAQVEATAVEETQNETPVETAEVTEEVAVTEDKPTEHGDLRVPLAQERKARQAYEAELRRLTTDKRAVFELAKKLGMADGEYEEDETTSPTPQTPAPQQFDQRSVSQMVEHQLEYKETIKEWPELATDPALRTWAASLVDSGLSPASAAAVMRDTMKGKVEQAKRDGAKEKETTISEKERASTITATVSQNSDAAEIEDLRAKAKNWKDPRGQEAATLELLKRGMSK